MVSRGRVARSGAGIVGSGAGLALLLSLVIAASAQASTTYYASPAGSGDCSSNSPCSLATAISSAGGGDTVELEGGTYTLGLGDGILLNDDITLTGAPGVSAVLSGVDLQNQSIIRANDGVNVEDLTFEQSISAITAAGGATTISDSTFMDNNEGVYSEGSATTDISNSTFYANAGTADLYVNDQTTVTSSTLVNAGGSICRFTAPPASAWGQTS